MAAHGCLDNVAGGFVKAAGKKVALLEARLVPFLVVVLLSLSEVACGVAVALILEGNFVACTFFKRVKVIDGIEWYLRTLVLALGGEGSVPTAVLCEVLGGMRVRTSMADLLGMCNMLKR